MGLVGVCGWWGCQGSYREVLVGWLASRHLHQMSNIEADKCSMHSREECLRVSSERPDKLVRPESASQPVSRYFFGRRHTYNFSQAVRLSDFMIAASTVSQAVINNN